MDIIKSSIKLITGPTTEPVTLAEAKGHIRVDAIEDDSYIEDTLIPAAREYCEGVLNRALITQQWELTFDKWPVFPFDVPKPPLSSVESIKYYDVKNIESVWAEDEYYVDTDSEPGRIALNNGKTTPNVSLRSINSVKVQFTAGYGDSTKVPLKIKQAILLLIGHWYSNRESVGKVGSEIDFTVSALLGIDRVTPI